MGKEFEGFEILCTDFDYIPKRFFSITYLGQFFLTEVQNNNFVIKIQFFYEISRSRKSANSRKASTTSEARDPNMPDDDLEPPKFARKALEKLLYDWNTVKAMIMTGHKDQTSKAIYEDQAFLSSQSGTALLDKFTHCLLVKNNSDMLDTLLNTLIRQIKLQPEVAKTVAKRFVRSVIRVFVVFNIELPPGQAKKRSSLHHHHHQPATITQPMTKCKRVFQGLINIAVEELCESANALLAPVRMGIARPTAPFNLSPNDSEIGKELFSVEPLTPKTVSSTPAASNRSRSRTRSLTVENLRSANRVSSNPGTAPNVQVEQDADMNEEVANSAQAQQASSSLEPMQQDFENEDSMMGQGVLEAVPEPDVDQPGILFNVNDL